MENEENNNGVTEGENETPSEQPPENNDSENSSAEEEGSEAVKTPEEQAAELLKKGKENNRILVDKERFDERNEKAKLFDTYSPVIDKVKDSPELLKHVLGGTEETVEERLSRIEEENRTRKQKEITDAVTEAIQKWPTFNKDWDEIQDQVEALTKRGLPFKEAIRRSYMALHPEEAETEARRMATENVNEAGKFQSGGNAPVRPSTEQEDETYGLTEAEIQVGNSLIGKDYGNGQVPIKTLKDYALLLQKHSSKLKAGGFFNPDIE